MSSVSIWLVSFPKTTNISSKKNNISIDVFLSKRVNDSQIVDVSTTESEAEARPGKASDQADEANFW